MGWFKSEAQENNEAYAKGDARGREHAELPPALQALDDAAGAVCKAVFSLLPQSDRERQLDDIHDKGFAHGAGRIDDETGEDDDDDGDD